MPYSVSIPQTLRMAITRRRYPPVPHIGTPDLQVLTRPNSFDRTPARRLLALGQQGADIDDALALLARDLGPVVGVGGVGQVLVLLVFLANRRREIVGADALPFSGDRPLDRQLLRPADDVLDHGARGEVL